MIKQDFIIALLEELGRKIAELKKKKENGDIPAADRAKQECYRLLNMNPDFIRTHTAKEIISALNRDTALTEQLIYLLLEDESCGTDRECLGNAGICNPIRQDFFFRPATTCHPPGRSYFLKCRTLSLNRPDRIPKRYGPAGL